MKKAVIIPIYLKFRQPEELPRLEGLSLAKRAIKSLKILGDQDFIHILPVCFDPTGGDSFNEMDRLLREELKDLGLQRALIFSSKHLEPFRQYLDQIHLKNAYSLIDLKGFSKIRNTGLLLAQALSVEVAIFMDNDEVIEDPKFLSVACEYLNETWHGKVVSGKGGFYVNPDGTILLPPQRLWWKCLWNKTKWMNRVWESILSSTDRLVQSPMLLGGNLTLHRDLFCRIPFDPYIPRGEDTDYLINANQFGFRLFFDKELKIRHLHPERTETYFLEELKGDMERFVYERKKVKGMSNFSLHPYPGYFLRWTLYPRAVLTSFFLSLDYLWRKEWGRAKESLTNLRSIFQKKKEGWPNYFMFRADWEKAMAGIGKDGMEKIIGRCWIGSNED